MTAVRLAAVALTMVTGFWPGIALYILAAALMEAAAPQGSLPESMFRTPPRNAPASCVT